MADKPPPSFGGHPQQHPPWPAHPAMIPPNFPSNPPFASTAQQPPAPGHPLDYNWASFYANSQMTGAGNNAAPGMFYPPPFPFFNPMDPSQALPPFTPPHPQAGHASIPALPPYMIQPQLPPTSTVHDVNKSSVPKNPPTVMNGNREEGEISDAEVGDFRSTNTRQAARRGSDLEEGETVSADSPYSRSRSSSPYIPPMSVATDSDLISRAIESQKSDLATPTSDADPQSIKSAAQLRGKAQGALLSLVPHNIQYHELVAEGLDPKILKQLYEGIGIKIPSPPPNKSVKTQFNSSPAQSSKTSKQQIPISAPPTQAKSSASTAEKATEKPLERKEVIARMLAEKAAKKSQPSTAQSSPKGSEAPSPSLAQKQPSAAPVKPKNKAQTDLARQRIEELKKQALLKKTQLKSNLPGAEANGKALESSADSMPVLHPLPVRPPAPQLSGTAAIPGLSMTLSKPDSSTQSFSLESRGIPVDSTPVARATQRKRPRASDFDEPDKSDMAPKKYSGQGPYGATERLVIDISEDEDEDEDGDDSIYDNQDSMDIDTSQGEDSESAAPINSSRPLLQTYPSGTRTSTSTPQGSSRPSEIDHIRQRQLEIQEMHRKIAELELKRKAKLAASRTDSPQTVNETPGGSSSFSASPAVSPVGANEVGTAGSASIQGVQDALGTPAINYAAQSNSSDQANDLHESTPDEAPVQNQALQPHSLNDEAASTNQVLADAIEKVSNAGTNSDGPVDLPTGHQGSLVDIQADSAAAVEPSSPSDFSGSAMDESGDFSGASEDSTSDEDGSKSDSSEKVVNEGARDNYLPNEEAASTPTDSNIVESTVPSPQAGLQEIPESSGHPLPARPSALVSEGDVMEITTSGGPGRPSNRESSQESEVYEPPEPEDSQDAGDSVYSPPFSPAPPAPVEDSDQPVYSTAAPVDSPSHEELTDERQPGNLEPRSDTQVILGNEPSSKPTGSFSPYVSPLRYFKAYRYHPSFAEDVPNGYRSLTYSQNVDPMKYLCPYEATGGVCNDRSCDNQHFRDMILSDDKILIQMGSVREGDTEQEREAYIAGLKEIINEMRREKVKDFGSVASEIAAYRRRFLQDPSRVLPL